jgi:adenylate cyclase
VPVAYRVNFASLSSTEREFISGPPLRIPGTVSLPSRVHIEFKFLEQLKHRNVGRVAILYVVVCYLILESFSVFIHVLGSPEWIGRTVAVLMVLGFPAALIFAWVFEMTPEGLKPTAEVDSRRSIRKLTGRRLDLAIIIVLVLALAYFAADKFWLSKRFATESETVPVAAFTPAAAPTAPAMSDKSIAVLPFTDMSEKKDQEYFADGMADEVIDLLANVPELKVIGRTSSFQFKGKTEDLRMIGSRLGAAYVVEGSVLKTGNRVRVTAQLIGTRDGVNRWSEMYERPFGDVLKLQNELAAGVARAMAITVGSDTLQRRAALKSPEAYDRYLRGLHSIDRYDREGFEAASSYFQQALDLDPSFGAAAAELGRMVAMQAEFGFTPAAETYERARHILETAIRLDPNSGMAHAWLGWVHMAYDWDWAAAETEMKQARRLAPRVPDGLLCTARLSMALGRWDDAMRDLKYAIALDPLYAAASNILSEVYARAGRLAEAEAAERRVLEISPTYSSGPYNLAIVLLVRGRLEEALKAISVTHQPTGDQAQGLALIYYALGRKADSNAQLATLVRDHASDAVFQIAEVHAYRAEADEAFRWLDRAYVQKDVGLYLIKGDLLLKRLERDSRYKAFLKKMNLPE